MKTLKKIGYIFGVLFLLLLAFTFYMSPSLVGILPGGIDEHDPEVLSIEFNSEPQLEVAIPYQDFSTEEDLIQLRQQYQLDTLISKGKSDFENVMNVQTWVHSRWKHDGDNVAEKTDPIYILEQAEKGEQFRCVEYSIVTSACLKSLGYIVRGLWLKTRDVDVVNYGAGHAVNEVYLHDKKKWFFMDPQFDIMVAKDGLPLNAVEFQKAIVNQEEVTVFNPSKEISDEDYKQWIGPYLFYFTTSLNNGPISVWDRIAGNKRQITLVPVGHQPPTYFQRLFRIKTNLKTNSSRDFYPTL